MLIHAEAAADEDAIRDAVTRAFAQPQEAQLVASLRRAGDLLVSRVAVIEGALVGHVALSPLQSPAGSVALAPLAVIPGMQRRGVGAALVQAVIDEAKRCGILTIFVLGDPAYYERFGFSAAAAAPYPSIYSGPHHMALHIAGERPAIAPVNYANAFQDLS